MSAYMKKRTGIDSIRPIMDVCQNAAVHNKVIYIINADIEAAYDSLNRKYMSAPSTKMGIS